MNNELFFFTQRTTDEVGEGVVCPEMYVGDKCRSRVAGAGGVWLVEEAWGKWRRRVASACGVSLVEVSFHKTVRGVAGGVC